MKGLGTAPSLFAILPASNFASGHSETAWTFLKQAPSTPPVTREEAGHPFRPYK